MRIKHVLLLLLIHNSITLVPYDSLNAAPKEQDNDTGCLSNYGITKLAKQTLPNLQVLDSSVTLTDVKVIIKSVGDCVTIDQANVALEQYASSLISDSPANTNHAPDIDGVPDSHSAEGVYYSFTPTASDQDGDALIFNITNCPAWASFNTSTGNLSGIPGYSDEGEYSNIVISVTDGTDSAALNAFAISVQDSNRAPSISGTPADSVSEGMTYLYTPVAFDPDGDTLSFVATNLPSWLNLDVHTGTLSGTPSSNDVALYEDIVVHVSDGIDTTAISPFSIMVEAATVDTGSANLSWLAPDTRTDGTYLDPGEIGGYRLYMSVTNDKNSLQIITDVNDGSTNDTISGLSVGVTYYFAVTAYDIEGNESSYQDTLVSKTIQ